MAMCNIVLVISVDLGIPVGGIREARSLVSARIRVKGRKGGDTAILCPRVQTMSGTPLHTHTHTFIHIFVTRAMYFGRNEVT